MCISISNSSFPSCPHVSFNMGETCRKLPLSSFGHSFFDTLVKCVYLYLIQISPVTPMSLSTWGKLVGNYSCHMLLMVPALTRAAYFLFSFILCNYPKSLFKFIQRSWIFSMKKPFWMYDFCWFSKQVFHIYSTTGHTTAHIDSGNHSLISGIFVSD